MADEGLDPLEGRANGSSRCAPVLSSASDFDLLRPAWNGLLGRAREASPFLSWEWEEAWWRVYGNGHSLRIYTAHRGRRLVGILPLYTQSVGLFPGLACRVLRFLGTGGDTSPDYLGALLDPDEEAETVAALVDEVLGDQGWDALWLSDVKEDSPLAQALAGAARRDRRRVYLGPPTRITILRLPDTWEALLDGVETHWRQEVRRRRRRVEELGARYVVWRDPATLDRAFDRLAELHLLRWAGRADRHSFSSPEYLTFHRKVFHRFFQRGWLRLFALLLGNEAIAMRYCFRFRDEVFAFQSGFDPVYERFSPGSVLMSHVVEHSIREGARLVDMLKGEYPHKETWSHEHRDTTHLRLYRRTLPGLLLRLREQEGPAAWRAVRFALGLRKTD